MSAEEQSRVDRVLADDELIERTNAGSDEAELLATLRELGRRGA